MNDELNAETKAAIESAVEIAAKHADANAESWCALKTAVSRIVDHGRHDLALAWALRSLRHSVGEGHESYKAVIAIARKRSEGRLRPQPPRPAATSPKVRGLSPWRTTQ